MARSLVVVAVGGAACSFPDFRIVDQQAGAGGTGAAAGAAGASGAGAGGAGNGAEGGDDAGGSAGQTGGSGGDDGGMAGTGDTGGTGEGGSGGLAGGGGDGGIGGAGGSGVLPCSSPGPTEQCAEILLDTTANGADVPTAAHDFPVLVRLNAANFDFASADVAGEDLRFTDLAGRQLSFEVESFSRPELHAEIWVRVPEILGAARQSLSMYWGAFGSESEGDSQAVFDDTAFFTGTWHFARGAIDATANGIHGVNRDTLLVPGIVGQAASLLGDGDHIDFGQPASLLNAYAADFSLTFWVRTALDTGVLVATKAWPAAIERGFSIYVEAGLVKVNIGDGAYSVVLSSLARIDDDRWHQIAVTLQRSDKARLYLDGEREAAADLPPLGAIVSTLNLVLGTDATGSSANEFDGLVDELRIEHTARDAAWERLTFRNQASEQRLVTVVPHDVSP